MCWHNKQIFEKVYILAVAVIVLLFCSQCSPLYITNQWADANIYFTIGRSMLEGKIPYVDLYDHKGPIIYFLHAIAAVISNKSFIGVWILEIACAYGFLYYANKTTGFFLKKKAWITVPLTALIVYTSNTLCAGDSAEELCLPFLMYCLCVGVKAIWQASIIDSRESIFVGICLGYIFWLKFTMIGFFVGLAIFFLIYYYNLNYFKECLRSFVIACSGFLLVTTFIFLYFVINDGLNDLVNVYFIDNIFTYNKASNFALANILSNIKNGIFSLTYYYYIGLLFIFLGWHYLLNYEKKELVIFNISCFAFLFLSSYAGGRTYNYYAFVFSIFVPLGMCMLRPLLENKTVFCSNVAVLVSLILCFSAAVFTGNKAYMGAVRENYLLEPYAKIIAQKKNATLINYNVMDLGLYNYCGIVPQYKYFSLTNIRHEKMTRGIEQYINEKKVDYIFTLQKYSFLGYSCVYSQNYNENGQSYPLCLYKRNDL